MDNPRAHKRVKRKEAALGSLRIGLASPERLDLPGNGGQALHGLFLALMGQDSPEMARRLHDMKGPKPFSLSPLEGECLLRDGRCLAAAGARVSFRVNLLETDLLGKAAATSWQALQNCPHLLLGGATVRVAGVEAVPGPGFVSFHGLIEAASQSREIGLEFLSPTAFRVERKNFLFPEPRLVFASLLHHWDAYSDRPLSTSVEGCLDFITVSRYQLQTEMVSFSKFKWIGFKGQVVYQLPQWFTPEQVKALNCLTEFSFYSGVGWKTTMGMGQCQRREVRSGR